MGSTAVRRQFVEIGSFERTGIPKTKERGNPPKGNKAVNICGCLWKVFCIIEGSRWRRGRFCGYKRYALPPKNKLVRYNGMDDVVGTNQDRLCDNPTKS